VLPAELFPTRYRSSAHGISAASGKLGAILAAFAFGPLADIGGPNASLPSLLGVFSICMLAGLLVTFWIPETAGRTLEEIARRDADEKSGRGLFAGMGSRLWLLASIGMRKIRAQRDEDSYSVIGLRATDAHDELDE
jgi:MFS family permease